MVFLIDGIVGLHGYVVPLYRLAWTHIHIDDKINSKANIYGT